MQTIINWIQNNIPETVAIILSSLSIILTIIFSRKEKPNIMPQGYVLSEDQHLSLNFLNTSQFSIHGLTILINGFDSELNESKQVDFSDKYLFSIGEKTLFNYGFNMSYDVINPFYFRLRFKGFYNTRLPFLKRKVEQVLWYSVFPITEIKDNKISLKIANTHKDDIDKIEAKHYVALKNYNQKIDKKYR